MLNIHSHFSSILGSSDSCGKILTATHKQVEYSGFNRAFLLETAGIDEMRVEGLKTKLRKILKCSIELTNTAELCYLSSRLLSNIFLITPSIDNLFWLS